MASAVGGARLPARLTGTSAAQHEARPKSLGPKWEWAESQAQACRTEIVKAISAICNAALGTSSSAFSSAAEKPIFFLNAGASVALSDEQLFGKLKQSNLGADDLLFGGHNGVLSNRRGGALRHPDRSASRLGYRCAVDQDTTVRLNLS